MKRLWTVLTLSLLLLGGTQHAIAEPELKLGSLDVFQGGTAVLHLSLSGGLEPYAGVNARILLPDGVTVTGVSKGAQLPEGFTIDWRCFSDQGLNGATVIAYSGVNTFTEPTGSLLDVSVQIAPTAPLRTHTIQLQNSGLSNEDGSISISHAILNGAITCFLPEQDSDGDGLSNAEELLSGTNPLSNDTDDDGYADGYESSTGTDPLDENDMPVIYASTRNTSGIQDGSKEYPYSTINECIAAAPDNYTVSVGPGIYEEAVTIDRNIRLIGASPTTTIIDAGGSVDAVYYSYAVGEMSRIEKFTITNASNGINCDNGASPMIRNNIITKIVDNGIVCSTASEAKIINNTIVKNTQAKAIQSASSLITIINNIVTDNHIGIAGNGSAIDIDYNNVWNNSGGNYVGCTPGTHDISDDPLFADSTIDNFHLTSDSPCLDAGDPVEKLTADYTGGDTVGVDAVTNMALGDMVWITDGTYREAGFVMGMTATTIQIQGAFMHNYLVGEGSYIFTDTSDVRNEPAPYNERIDMGAYGNTPEARPAPPGVEDFETGNLSRFPWVTTGSGVWSVTTATNHTPDGVYAAEAPQIVDTESASLEVRMYCEEDNISFWYAVSSEQGYDFLHFYIDDVQYGAWSGEVPHTQATFAVTSGMHTFRWVYAKDKLDASGADTAWVDDISFPMGIDFDFDGMPDGWETNNGLDSWFDDADEDPDGDGFSNIREYEADTNPQNANDFPPVAPITTVDMHLPSGWSMISIPVVPEDTSLSNLFPGAVVVYGYERSTGYVRVKNSDTLAVGRGYWMLLNEEKTYSLTGQSIPSYTKTVSEDGWEMIGGCTDPAQVIPHNCDSRVIYGYTQGLGYQRVQASENLTPGQGYWILFDDVTGQAEMRVETITQDRE